MGKQHISRLAVPKSWDIPTKTNKFVTRPMPGAHPLKLGIPLSLVIRDNLGFAKTAKEVKTLLHKKEVFVDGKVRGEPKFIVGIMDVLSFPKIKANFRIMLNKRGKLAPVEIKDAETNIKLAKIINKVNVKGKKMQLNLSDGRNMLVDKGDFKTGSTVVVEIPANKIKDTLALEKGSIVLLTGGKHIGSVGVIESIEEDKVVYKDGDKSHLTLKKYAFVIGKNKPLITLPE